MLYDEIQSDGLTKEQRKEEIRALREKLAALQQPLKAAGLPVIVLIEGWAAAGKGELLSELISRLDPRFVSVFSLDGVQADLTRYPFIYPFANAIPENGHILFMDSGWAERAVAEYMATENEDTFERRITSVRTMERQLVNNGYVLIKLFVDIDRSEQKKRQKELLADSDTAWRVSDYDLEQNRHYDEFREAYDDFLCRTDDIEPWHILSGESRSAARRGAYSVIVDILQAAIEAGRRCGLPYDEVFPMSEPAPRLSDADLSLTIGEEEYRTELKSLQKRVKALHNELYRRRIPVIIAYEGWDAAGKGGNIRRLAEPLDPRGFNAWPIASPLPQEKNRHFLWRFWQRIPRLGHVAIFDRTWYGRVMVERIEGFCTENDWQRAYAEINEFEEELTDWGAVVLKFWLQIDPDTQLQRFTDRQNTPEKQWKITDEDWRNRDKWPQYEQAVSEMLSETSTAFAPWHVIESVDKRYARIKVLRIIVEEMERAIREKEK